MADALGSRRHIMEICSWQHDNARLDSYFLDSWQTIERFDVQANTIYINNSGAEFVQVQVRFIVTIRWSSHPSKNSSMWACLACARGHCMHAGNTCTDVPQTAKHECNCTLRCALALSKLETPHSSTTVHMTSYQLSIAPRSWQLSAFVTWSHLQTWGIYRTASLIQATRQLHRWMTRNSTFRSTCTCTCTWFKRCDQLVLLYKY